MLCMMGYTTWTGSPLYQLGPVGFHMEGVFVSTFTILMGSSLVFAGVQCYRGKGWQALRSPQVSSQRAILRTPSALSPIELLHQSTDCGTGG
jgi:hypothetical protein